MLSARYHLTLSRNDFSVPQIAKETLRITDLSNQPVARFEMKDGMIQCEKEKPIPDWIPMTSESKQLFRSDHTLLGVIGTQPMMDLWAGIRHMEFYNFIPESMRAPQLPIPGQLLHRNGGNLASIIASTSQSEKWAIERIGSYLSAVVREVEGFEVVPYGEYKTIRFRFGSSQPDKTLEFDAASMSDGTLRALAALTAAFQNVPPYGCPSVVGIEEPESALHPAAIRALVDALDDASQRTQILLTTHSADILDNPTIRPENVRVADMCDGQTIIGPVDEASVDIVRRKLDTLGGLERQDQLDPDLDDRQRQQRLSGNGQES